MSHHPIDPELGRYEHTNMTMCVSTVLQSFVFDSVPAPNSKKGMQAAALIAAKRKKSMGPEAAAVPSVAPVAPAVAPGAAVPSAAAATAPAAAGDAAEQGPAKRPRLG